MWRSESRPDGTRESVADRGVPPEWSLLDLRAGNGVAPGLSNHVVVVVGRIIEIEYCVASATGWLSAGF
jgi:hypothetical protein